MAIELKEGSVLAGRFRLERLLGQGGMGVVWAAMNTATGRRVAIKMLRDANAADPHVRRRFLREGRAASAVQHPNVVEILDVFELEDQTPAMVMEMLDGESLGQRLRRVRTLSIEEMAKLLVPAVAAVGAAHALGIVHRDLKPDNIFLAAGLEGATVVKVLDFGIAKITSESEQGQSAALTGTGAMLGTPYYMAPEQLFSDETLDYRCDIWALGIIFYECLAGKRPTRGDTFADIVKVIATHSILKLETAAPKVPPEVCELVGRMLSFDKKNRPQSLHDVLVVLKHYTDALASSFGEPMLKQIKQSRDDDSSPSLQRSDMAFLVDQPQSTTDAVTMEANSDRISQGSIPTVDVGSETRRLTDAETTGKSKAVTADPTRDQGARGKRRAWPYVVGVGVVAAAVAVAGRGALRSSTGTMSDTATPPLPASIAPVVPASAAPSAGVAVTPPPSAAVSVASAPPVESAAARPRPPPSGAVGVRRPLLTTAPPGTGSPTDTGAKNPSTSPGGLVEKPPF